MGKSEGKNPLGIPRSRWETNRKVHLQELGWVDAEWIAVAEHKDMLRAVVNEAMKFWLP